MCLISFIEGKLVSAAPGQAVINAGGIGFRILIPSARTPLPPYGEDVRLYTYLSVTQDGMTLYGASTEDEMELFRMMITVSGIGPKGALGILGTLSPDEIRMAILTEDDKAIARSPGIGKKTARKMILDLKDKIGELPAGGFFGDDLPGGTVPLENDAAREAIEALTALGYTGLEAANAVRAAAQPDMDTEAILKAALRML